MATAEVHQVAWQTRETRYALVLPARLVALMVFHE